MKINFLRPSSNVLVLGIILISFISCTNYFKNDYNDNSPTSGKLKVYYDEGLQLHLENHIFTFESFYPNAHIQPFQTSENEAVQALYNDSCKAIVISRMLNATEQKAFQSKKYTPKYSAVAKSGVALITNVSTQISKLTYQQIIELLSKPFVFKDSIGNNIQLNVLIDKKNSAVMHYLLDSILKGQAFSANCNVLNSSKEGINFVAKNKNTIAFIDFAWLSDVDDSIYIANKSLVKFIAVSKLNSNVFQFPNQSSFKLNTYPFTRTIYVYRNTDDFSLAKGFETFVAGPKGQNTFLKQGLLPTHQQERNIKITTN
jgi:ABC-type phosphate transport system substrate-binding protein